MNIQNTYTTIAAAITAYDADPAGFAIYVPGTTDLDTDPVNLLESGTRTDLIGARITGQGFYTYAMTQRATSGPVGIGTVGIGDVVGQRDLIDSRASYSDLNAEIAPSRRCERKHPRFRFVHCYTR